MNEKSESRSDSGGVLCSTAQNMSSKFGILTISEQFEKFPIQSLSEKWTDRGIK